MGAGKERAEGFTDYVLRAYKYAVAVVDGRVVAGKWVKAACQRQLDDLERLPGEGYYFDSDEANRVCQFIELLPHIKGEWARRRERIKLEDWQCFVVTTIFGWMRPDGRRRFRTAYLEVARKNAKSTLLAAIGLFLLAADGEAGAEVYSLATKREQAKEVWSVAHNMAKRERGFLEEFGIDVKAHNINIPDWASKFEALSSDDNSLDGLNVHGGIIDELHAHKTRGLWDVIETATGARSQPLVFAITTAGSNRSGICYEQRQYVTKVLNATLHTHEGMGYRIDGDTAEDETYFGIIYTIDDEDDWTNPEVWIKANPNLGVSVALDDLQRKCKKAMQMASAAPNFQTKHLNVWVNADAAWMDMIAWERQADRNMRMKDFADWDWYLAVDFAERRDITAIVALAMKNREYRLFGKYFLPEAAIEESDNSQYAGWIRAEHLNEGGEHTIDFDLIEEEIETLATKLRPVGIGFDPFKVDKIAADLDKRGLPMIETRATVVNFSPAMKEFEAAIIDGRMKHDGNPVMTWMISNVVCHRDAKDNIYPRKERVENKIDGPVATIIALNMAVRNEGGEYVGLTFV